MSYLVLARKYRSRDFSQVVGQDHVVRALTHALETGRLHHAYLFTGTRGVGKTTLSRILAKSLNCVGANGQGGITATPCGVCEACTAIDAGRFVDYVEMDAASNRGVDEMTALLERAAYAPSAARFKVYMIDEVHMLSNHAFNAMLKTLEEPPPYLKFILATTDPQKVPVTVLSRCLQFNLKQMPPGAIVGHLDHVLEREGVTHDANALRLLAQAAHGSMRDALSLTDQAIAYAAGPVTESAVRAMLGAVDTDYLVRVCDALLAEDGAQLFAVADAMAERSLSFHAALQELALMFQRMALAQRVPESLPDDLPEAADLRRLAKQFDPQEVQLHYQIAIHGRNELALAPDEYAGFTMTLLRMLAFKPGTVPRSEGRPGVSAEAGSATVVAAAAAPTPRGSSPAAVRTAVTTAPAAGPHGGDGAALAGTISVGTAAVGTTTVGSASAREAAMAALRESGVPVRAAGRSPAAPLLAPRPAVSVTAPAASSAATAAANVVTSTTAPRYAAPEIALPAHEDWPTLSARLELKGVTRALARQSELIAIDGVVFRLRVPTQALIESSSVERLRVALAEVLGEARLRVEPEIGPVTDSAQLRYERAAAARQADAEQTFMNHPIVNTLMEHHGASVVPGSIKPLENAP